MQLSSILKFEGEICRSGKPHQKIVVAQELNLVIMILAIRIGNRAEAKKRLSLEIARS